MSQNDERNMNYKGWTPETLLTYIECQIERIETGVHERFQAQEKAIEEAQLAATQRFEAQEKMLEQRFQAADKTQEKGFAEAELRNEQRFQAQEKAVIAAMLSAERAVAKAEAASEKRFESVNEFRASMNDQARAFIPRSEAEQRMLSNSEKTDAIGIRLERMEGRGAGLNAGWAILTGAVGLVGVITAVIMAFFRH